MASVLLQEGTASLWTDSGVPWLHSGEDAALLLAEKWIICVPAFPEDFFLLWSCPSPWAWLQSGDVCAWKSWIALLTKFSLQKWLLSLFPLCSSSSRHPTALPFASCVDLQVLFSSSKRNKTAWFLRCMPLDAMQFLFLFPSVIRPRSLFLVGRALHPPCWYKRAPTLMQLFVCTCAPAAKPQTQRSNRIFHRHKLCWQRMLSQISPPAHC